MKHRNHALTLQYQRWHARRDARHLGKTLAKRGMVRR